MTIDFQQMARDWITIWQSEFNAAAHDRELLEGFAKMVNHWAHAAQIAASFLPAAPPSSDHERGRAGSGASAGATAPDAASDARDAALQRLVERVAELERIIAGFAPPAA